MRWKRLLVTAAAFAVVGVLAYGPHLLWRSKPTQQLGIVIVDKTVPFELYREHENFNWLLEAWKIQSDGKFLDPKTDYVGFDPIAKKGHDLTAEHLRGKDMVFVADTYGVYIGDYEVPGDVAAMERSPKIFGGFSVGEADLLRAFAERGGLLVAEFNTFASPTGEPARQTLEQVFGVRWTRWVARFWSDLQDPSEVPPWVGKVYEKLYERPFDLTGSGLMFVRDDKEMIILQPGEHLKAGTLSIRATDQVLEDSDWPDRGRYRFWLDVIEAPNADVFYEYQLEVTESGQALLDSVDLPKAFPALSRSRAHPGAWYFAGDFVDTPDDEIGDPRRVGVLNLRRGLAWVRNRLAGPGFLWGWYAPTLEQIVLTKTSTPALPTPKR